MREHNPVGQGMEFAMPSNSSVVNKGVTWSDSAFVLKVELARFTDSYVRSEEKEGPKNDSYLQFWMKQSDGTIR